MMQNWLSPKSTKPTESGRGWSASRPPPLYRSQPRHEVCVLLISDHGRRTAPAQNHVGGRSYTTVVLSVRTGTGTLPTRSRERCRSCFDSQTWPTHYHRLGLVGSALPGTSASTATVR